MAVVKTASNLSNCLFHPASSLGINDACRPGFGSHVNVSFQPNSAPNTGDVIDLTGDDADSDNTDSDETDSDDVAFQDALEVIEKLENKGAQDLIDSDSRPASSITRPVECRVIDRNPPKPENCWFGILLLGFKVSREKLLEVKKRQDERNATVTVATSKGRPKTKKRTFSDLDSELVFDSNDYKAGKELGNAFKRRKRAIDLDGNEEDDRQANREEDRQSGSPDTHRADDYLEIIEDDAQLLEIARSRKRPDSESQRPLGSLAPGSQRRPTQGKRCPGKGMGKKIPDHTAELAPATAKTASKEKECPKKRKEMSIDADIVELLSDPSTLMTGDRARKRKRVNYAE